MSYDMFLKKNNKQILDSNYEAYDKNNILQRIWYFWKLIREFQKNSETKTR